MWEQLYISSSQHYLIEDNNSTFGYCCIDETGCLTQIFLTKDHLSWMDKVIKELIATKMVNSASLSSNEPKAFNACLLHSKSVKTNTFCFEHLNKEIEVDAKLNIELVATNDIPLVKEFLKEQVGMDQCQAIFTKNPAFISLSHIFSNLCC